MDNTANPVAGPGGWAKIMAHSQVVGNLVGGAGRRCRPRATDCEWRDQQVYLALSIGRGKQMSHFPLQLRNLPKFDGPFDAHRLSAERCDVLFASYPANTVIPSHVHGTDNVGIITQGELILTMNGTEQRFGVGSWYHVPANMAHAARFDVPTSEIEFWFEADR